ncbi:MAG: hypothetical protein KF843_07550 [Flavobacteriales bacterium]|nr:hypothetical protein [Flavobacteriales bacterium]
MTVIGYVHRSVRHFKHWQAFLILVFLIGLVGYPLYLLGCQLFSWKMPFSESPAPAIVVYICYGIWLDTVLASGGKSRSLRGMSAMLLLIFAGASIWLRKDEPAPDFVYIIPLFILGIVWIWRVLVPSANALRIMDKTNRTGMPIWIDVVLMAALFPFGLWLLQPRLNQSESCTLPESGAGTGLH